MFHRRLDFHLQHSSHQCQAVSLLACEVMTIQLLLLILGNTELNDQFAVMLLVEAVTRSFVTFV